jgi:hypothetical protein
MRVSTWVKNRTGMLLLLAGLASALGVAAAAPLLWAEQSRGAATTTSTNARNGRQAALQDQLTAGLKARTPADRAFVELVVTKVEQGKLSRKLVDSTFLWARKRAATRSGSHRLRPMVYFRPALILRAKQLGIDL